MTQYIATRLHKALEIEPDEPFLVKCGLIPHYVIDDSLIFLLERSDFKASINALIEAGIARLPFSPILIECSALNEDTSLKHDARSFVILEEDGDHIRAMVGLLDGTNHVFEVDPKWFNVWIRDGSVAVDGGGRSITYKMWGDRAGLAVIIALLMLNIKGVDREVIFPEKLNKQRTSSGKPSIPRHHLVRIAHVYSRDGRELVAGGVHRKKMHLRSGFTRRQHFGEGNEQIKMVYIPPVIVNFDPNKEAAVPRKIVAA